MQFDDEPAGARVTNDSAWIGGPTADLDRVFRQLFHFSVTHLLGASSALRAARGRPGQLRRSTRTSSSACRPGQVDPRGSPRLHRGGDCWPTTSSSSVGARRGLEATGIARSVAVPGDLGAVLPVPAPPVPGDQRGRRDLGVDRLTRGWFPVVGVIVVGHSVSADGELESLAGEPTLYRVLGSFSSATDPLLLTQFFPIAGAPSRLPSWRLGHGVDAGTRPRRGATIPGRAQRSVTSTTSPASAELLEKCLDVAVELLEGHVGKLVDQRRGDRARRHETRRARPRPSCPPD